MRAFGSALGPLAFAVALFTLAGSVGASGIFLGHDKRGMDWTMCFRPGPGGRSERERHNHPHHTPFQILGPENRWPVIRGTQMTGVILFSSDTTGHRIRDNSGQYEISQEILADGNVRHTYRYLGNDLSVDHTLERPQSLVPAIGGVGPLIRLHFSQPVSVIYRTPSAYWLKFKVGPPQEPPRPPPMP